MPETVTAETPVAAPAEEVQAPAVEEVTQVTPEAAPVETPPEETTAPPAPSWDDIKGYLDAEDYPDHEQVAEWKTQHKSQGWTEALDYIKPQIEQSRQQLTANAEIFTKASAGYDTLRGVLNKAITEGDLTEETLASALQRVPDAWKGLNAIGEQAQRTAYTIGENAGRTSQAWQTAEALIEFSSKALGRPSLHSEFAPRLAKVRDAIAAEQRPSESWEDVAGAWIKQIDTSAYKRGLADGRKGGKEEATVETRKGQKPPSALGSTGGATTDQNRLDRLALGRDSAGNEPDDEDRAWLAARR